MFPTESLIRRVSTRRRGDVRALATSSIAVASSIGSPSLSDNHLPDPDERRATHLFRRNRGAIGQEPNSRGVADSVWQTAYSTARMAIDITKESSDMFLPLKAVVGAISVLIKNYDVSPVPITVELLC
jgi:hypothetical protein